MRFKYLTLVPFFFSSIFLLAQREHMHNFNLQSSFLVEIPGGDLADRYGTDTKFEIKAEYLSKKLFALYLKGGLRINQSVKEDVLSSIRTEDGFIIGTNGFYADVFGRKRGFDAGIGIDKLFPVADQYLRIGLAGSFITHWINFVDDSQAVPQIQGKTNQYFDRFVSGFGIEENIQFQYNNKTNRAGFLFGFQIGQFFTKEHRYQFIGNDAKERRLDLYFGAKVTYLLPIYTFEQEKTVFY